MTEAAAIIFAETLGKLCASTSVAEVRRLAASGLKRLHAARGLNGTDLLGLLREIRDARVLSLLGSAASRNDGVLGDVSRLNVAGLTHRECEVLGWIALGKRDAEIAAILGIAKKTVGKHIEHVLSKLHVETRTAAVNAAHEKLRRFPRRKPGR